MSDATGRRHFLFWTLALLGLGLDIGSKYAVFASMGFPSNPACLAGNVLRFHTARNRGTFFGLGGETGWLGTVLVVLTVLMIAYVIYIYLVPPKESRSRIGLHVTGLALVLAGASGNLYDRVVFRYVRDFIDLGIPGWKRWPTFNLADVWLVAGITLYVFALMRTGKEKGDGTGVNGEIARDG